MHLITYFAEKVLFQLWSSNQRSITLLMVSSLTFRSYFRNISTKYLFKIPDGHYPGRKRVWRHQLVVQCFQVLQIIFVFKFLLLSALTISSFNLVKTRTKMYTLLSEFTCTRSLYSAWSLFLVIKGTQVAN